MRTIYVLAVAVVFMFVCLNQVSLEGEPPRMPQVSVQSVFRPVRLLWLVDITILVCYFQQMLYDVLATILMVNLALGPLQMH